MTTTRCRQRLTTICRLRELVVSEHFGPGERIAERSNGERATTHIRSILFQIGDLPGEAATDSDELFDGLVELKEKFHQELLQLAQSPMLEGSLDQVTALPLASPSAFLNAGIEQVKNRNVIVVARHLHRALVDATVAGESARAASTGREHAQTVTVSLKQLSNRNDIDRLSPTSNLMRWATDGHSST